ncbi:MAG TPA: dihydrolipoamide acetyltransferase family protein [Kribbella sp.]|nr:dihydrolipoamide acetyltransferase family protein [Kribbella sp.]
MTVQTFLLPDLGEGLTEAEVVRWLVTVGDVVAVDAPVVEVETAKSIVEVPSPYAGVVAELHGEEGGKIDVGKPLITIGSLPESAAPVANDQAAEAYREEEQAGSGNVLIGYGTPEGGAPTRRRKPRAMRMESSAPAPTGVPLVISPLVRRLARDAKVDLTQLTGSGAGGVITRRDVESAIAPPPPSTPSSRPAATDSRTGLPVLLRTPMSGFRKAVAATLSRSRTEIPEATTWVDVDATALVDLRDSLRTTSDPGPGLLALMARFVVAGLQRYPELNGEVDTEREELVQYDGVNLGLATQTERGLVVPAVVGAQAMTARGLDAEIRRLTAAARDGRLTARELSSGTFTLNNYGSFGVDGSAAIINHPQVAILGVGRIMDRPWVVDGAVVVRKLTQLSLVFDHRVCDGGTAAGFLRFVADAFESPTSAFADL